MFEALGRYAPADLSAARLQLHWAVQVVMAAGDSLLPKQTDDSHTNMVWLDEARALTGWPIGEGPRACAALRLEDLTLLVINTAGNPVAEYPLDGKTLGDALGWMGEHIAAQTGNTVGSSLAIRKYDMPEHPVADGAVFRLEDPEQLLEVARWFSNADELLDTLKRESHLQSSEVAVWPHHFDAGLLLLLEPEKGSKDGKTIGLGFSPGDATIAEPYWYARGYPFETPRDLPPLPLGEWNTDGFFAGILTGTEIVQTRTPDAQRDSIETFLNAAIAQLQKWLTD